MEQTPFREVTVNALTMAWICVAENDYLGFVINLVSYG
jgi:hypothetical protein